MSGRDRSKERDDRETQVVPREGRHRKAGEPRMPKRANELNEQQRPGFGVGGSSKEELDR